MYTRRGLASSVMIGGGKSVCTRRTSILSGCSLGSLGSRGSSSGKSLLGVPRMLLKKTGSADAQEDTVQAFVRDLNLLLARFQVQDLVSPRCRHGSWVRRTLKCTTHQASATCSGSMTAPCNSRVAITRVRTFFLTCLMAFSTMPTDAVSYIGGACAIARTPKRSFSSLITASRKANMAGSLSDLTIQVAKSVQRLDRFLDCCLVFHTFALNKRAPNYHVRLHIHYLKRSGTLGVLTVVSVSEETIIHAGHKQTVLFFMPSFVSVRPPGTNNTSTKPIAIWIATACLVGLDF